MRTRVKICGITRHQDAEIAVAAGADALGLVFYSASPRAVSITQAEKICADLPPFVTVVGLFVDADIDVVQNALNHLPLSMLQFHGNESAAYCEQFDRPYLKAIRMQTTTELSRLAEDYATATALLLDSYQPGIPGGTGQTFDWSMINKQAKPIILAGGLNAENVASAIHKVRPYAVDVSGGVEKAKGVKDKQKIQAFMQEVKNA